MFRREHGRPFYADERNNFHQIRPQPPQFHPRERFETYDAPYFDEIPSGPIRPRRRVPMPQYYEEEPVFHADNYRSYQSSEPDLGPKPLLDPDTIERLRANLSMVNDKLNLVEGRYKDEPEDGYDDRYEDRYQNRYEERHQNRYEDRYQNRYEDRYEDGYDDRYEHHYDEVCDREPERYRRHPEPCPGPSSAHREMIDYVQDKESTKKTIEDIIMVAQALHEKLEHNEDPVLEYREEPSLEHHEELMLEHYDAPIPEVQSPIEYYEEGNEILPPYPGRRPPLLKTPRIQPFPLNNPEAHFIHNKPIKNQILSTKLPSLLDIKPQKKIPSLLELQLEPPEPEIFQENFEPFSRFVEPRLREICWNCNKRGHRHEACWFPPKEFCYRCGTQGVNEETCPKCPQI